MLLINWIDVKSKVLLYKSFHYSQLKWITLSQTRDKDKLRLPEMDRSNMTNNSGGGRKGFPASRPCTFVQCLQTWIRRGWRLQGHNKLSVSLRQASQKRVEFYGIWKTQEYGKTWFRRNKYKTNSNTRRGSVHVRHMLFEGVKLLVDNKNSTGRTLAKYISGPS